MGIYVGVVIDEFRGDHFIFGINNFVSIVLNAVYFDDFIVLNSDVCLVLWFIRFVYDGFIFNC